MSSGDVRPRLAIIGGSGMCTFPDLEVIKTVKSQTKYGLPSDDIVIGRYAGETIAFLPRHARAHSIAPHKVPYKANIAALKELGVEFVVGTCIAGSLRKDIAPESFVLMDQFVNLTWGRDDYTEADGGAFIHLPMAEPYCKHLRERLLINAQQAGIPMVPTGTVVVIQGPRFSTVAESRFFSAQGWDVVNMTQYPECYFAREQGLCYAAFAAITDYDVGLQERLVIDHQHMTEVLAVFRKNIEKTRTLLLAFIQHEAGQLRCACSAMAIRAYYEM